MFAKTSKLNGLLPQCKDNSPTARAEFRLIVQGRIAHHFITVLEPRMSYTTAVPGRFESEFAHSPPSPAGLTRGSIHFAWILRN